MVKWEEESVSVPGIQEPCWSDPVSPKVLFKSVFIQQNNKKNPQIFLDFYCFLTSTFWNYSSRHVLGDTNKQESIEFIWCARLLGLFFNVCHKHKSTVHTACFKALTQPHLTHQGYIGLKVSLTCGTFHLPPSQYNKFMSENQD